MSFSFVKEFKTSLIHSHLFLVNELSFDPVLTTLFVGIQSAQLLALLFLRGEFHWSSTYTSWLSSVLSLVLIPISDAPTAISAFIPIFAVILFTFFLWLWIIYRETGRIKQTQKQSSLGAGSAGRGDRQITVLVTTETKVLRYIAYGALHAAFIPIVDLLMVVVHCNGLTTYSSPTGIGVDLSDCSSSSTLILCRICAGIALVIFLFLCAIWSLFVFDWDPHASHPIDTAPHPRANAFTLLIYFAIVALCDLTMSSSSSTSRVSSIWILLAVLALASLLAYVYSIYLPWFHMRYGMFRTIWAWIFAWALVALLVCWFSCWF